MKNRTPQVLLIITSILGFLLITASLVLTLFLNDSIYLYGLIPGVLLSLVSLTLSNRTTLIEPDTEETFEVMMDSPITTEIPIIKTSVIENDELEIVPVEHVDIIETLDVPVTIQLEIDEKYAEALLRLTEKMIDRNLLRQNVDYDIESSNDVYKEIFKPIPIIGLAKNRKNNFNILAGLSHEDVEVIGTIKEKDLELIKVIYPKTQNIRGSITGGKYRTPHGSEHTQAHRVNLTFFT